MAVPEHLHPLHPLQPEPEDARILQHIRDWLELNRIALNMRDMKRTDYQERREN